MDVVVADGLGSAPRQTDEREHAEANEDVAAPRTCPALPEDAPPRAATPFASMPRPAAAST